MPDFRTALSAALIAALLLIACEADEAIRLRYTAEQKLHRAERAAKSTQLKPQSVTPEQMSQLRSLYGDVLDFTFDALQRVDSAANPTEYQELSGIAYRGTFRLAGIYYAQKQYDTCMAMTELLLSRVDLSGADRMNAHVFLGQATQAAGHWDSAVAIYTHALDSSYPPIDDQGDIQFNLFNLPLLMVQVSRLTGDSSHMNGFVRQAEQYYQRLIGDYPSSNLATASHANLARLYYDNENWRSAVAHLGQLVDSTGIPVADARIQIADIYSARLNLLDSALALYDALYRDVTGRDTVYRPLLLYKQSLVHLQKKKYGLARQTLVNLDRQYPEFYSRMPTAQFAKAQTFDKEGNWDRAETEYKFLIEQYEGTDQAMTAHLYLARRLKELGRITESESWYRRAEEYFDGVASRGAGTEREARALTYKAELFRERKQWAPAALVLTDIFSRYPQSRLGRNALMMAVLVYRERLNQPQQADSLMEVFRSEYVTPEASADPWQTEVSP